MSGTLHIAAMTNVAAGTSFVAAAATAPPPAARMNLAQVAFDRSLWLRATMQPATPTVPNLPLLASRSGSLFADARDAQARWYLPSFALAADVDTRFAFAATQSGQDIN